MDCIKGRRSIRVFKDQPVSKDDIKKIIEMAMWTPTWKNAQTTRFIAIEDREVIDKISLNHMPSFNRRICETAPLLFAVTAIKGDSGYDREGKGTIYGEAYTHFDCGGTCQTLCLAAHDMGMDTVQMGIFDVLETKEILGVPENEDLLIIIACGYSNQEQGGNPRRKTVDDVLRFV